MNLFNVNPCLLVTIVTLVLAGTNLRVSSAADDDKLSQLISVRNDLKLTDLLNIDNYQKTFNKHYGSIVEILSRMQILMARGLRVFVAATNYLRGFSRSYKKINHFSDRTKEELDQLSNKREINVIGTTNRIKRKKRGVTTRSRSKTQNHHLKAGDLYEHNDDDDDDDKNSENESGSFESDDSNSQRTELTGDQTESIAMNIAGRTRSKSLGFNSDDQGEKENVPIKGDEVFVDHRNCLTDARDQGYIGGCYAFSSIALAEWMYCRDTGNKLLFSEQFILDCGNGYRSLEGDGGGFERDVGSFIDEFGLELLENYPFEGEISACPYDRTNEMQKMGYLKVNDYTYQEVALEDFETVLEETPLIVSIDIGEQWYEYGGGVFENPGHDAEDVETHSILIVGWGHQDGVEYWLIRNSHGSAWGEEGHVKLSKSCPCIYMNRGYRSGALFGSRKSRRRPSNPQHEPRIAKPEKNNKRGMKKKKQRSYF